MRMPTLSSLITTAAFPLSVSLAFGPASPAAASPVQTASETARVIGAEADLRQLLGSQYATFERNFTQTANPVLLKDGGLLVDGWRNGAPLAHAAAFIHYPDGRAFAAWFDQETGHVTYVGDGPVHPAIMVWARRFGPAIEVLPASTQSRIHLRIRPSSHLTVRPPPKTRWSCARSPPEDANPPVRTCIARQQGA